MSEKKKAAPAPADQVALSVKSPVDHDGVRYAPGEVLVATAAQAEALIAAGAAEAADG
jgi:hypothetical protein